MKIRDVMTSNPRTVSPNDTVQSAAQVMKAEDTGAVPVVENRPRHRRACRCRGQRVDGTCP